jgi:hypothetical protein
MHTEEITPDEAMQQMKDTWGDENDCKIVAWNAQLEQDLGQSRTSRTG